MAKKRNSKPAGRRGSKKASLPHVAEVVKTRSFEDNPRLHLEGPMAESVINKKKLGDEINLHVSGRVVSTSLDEYDNNKPNARIIVTSMNPAQKRRK